MLQPGDSLLQCLWQPGAGTTFPSPKEWAGFLKISRAPLLLSTVVEAAVHRSNKDTTEWC